MTTLRTEWTADELLESIPVEEPLVAGGVKCHGGFDGSGAYVSPRTANRWEAIRNWQAQHAEQFGTDLLDMPLDSWPEAYPNVAQARFLLEHGVREPIVATLTRIGTVEGFGSMIRYSLIPDFQACFDEEVRGTAITHLDRGLFEAHARDEAGYGDEGGHKQMWFAARDVAFEHPVTEDQTQTMLERMGITNSKGSRGSLIPDPIFPDVDTNLELLIARMAGLLLIEISAHHVFAWAEEVLGDTEVVAGDGEASRLVSYIRADEAPHVAYLATVLSEMRDRTFVTTSGRKVPGTTVVGTLWDRAVGESLGVRREQNLRLTLREVEHALEGRPDGRDLLEEFHARGSIRPTDEGAWEPVGVGY
ncbi:MAG: hypothetical protein M3394_07210 [Actinomycetota bacterium]|nr:hypothetical protein [Actinomycetota bacterium]